MTRHGSRRSPATLFAALPTAVLLAAVLAGCLATIPGPEEREATAGEVASVYVESGDRFLDEAGAALERARQAAGIHDARRHLSVAWESYQSAWDRYTLAASTEGLVKTAAAVIHADVGSSPDAIADGVGLFSSIMKRFQAADPAFREAPVFRTFLEELHAYAREAPADYDGLRRRFAAELEIWRIAGASPGDEHHGHLVELLRLAEHDEALRGHVPYDWSRAAVASVRKGQ